MQVMINGELAIICGANSIFTRRSLHKKDIVICGGYCVTCDNHSQNPGCKISDILLQVCSKHWNNILVIKDY